MHLILLPLGAPLYMLTAFLQPCIGWQPHARSAPAAHCPSACRHKPVPAAAQPLSIPTHSVHEHALKPEAS